MTYTDTLKEFDPTFETFETMDTWIRERRQIALDVEGDSDSPIRVDRANQYYQQIHRVINAHPNLRPDLRECANPWCREKGDGELQILGYDAMDVFVSCASCGLNGPSTRNRYDAVLEWNKRPTDNLLKAVEPFVMQQRGFFYSGNCGPDRTQDWGDGLLLFIHSSDDMSPVGQDLMSVKQWRDLATEFEKVTNPKSE